MSANTLASGDWPGRRNDWNLWGGEMRGAGLSRVRDVGGLRWLGGTGLYGPFHPDFTSGAIVPETAPPDVVDKLGVAGISGAGDG